MSRQHPLTDRQFRHDDHGVSEVLGAILVFALLILLVVLIQVNAVPAANEQVEFEHNQRVVQDFQSLQDGLFRASATGQEVSIPVETGISYPPRFFLLNPGPATGAIRTTGQQSLTIENAQASGEVKDFWTGNTPQTYATTGLTYRPDYNELQRAGTLHLEHSMVYRNFDGGNRYFDDPTSFVDGNRIRLTLLTGNVSRGGLSTSVEFAPISHHRRTVTIEDATEKITITFQTDLDVDTLNREITENEDNVESITKSGDVATMTLKRGTYELTMSKIRVGSTSVDQPDPAYITDTGTYDRTISEGTSQRMVVEVRDRFNNPVSGEPVGLQANAGGIEDSEGDTVSDGTTVQHETDNDGQVVIDYTAPDVSGTENEDMTVTAWIAPDGSNSGLPQNPGSVSEERKVTFTVTVENTDRSGLPPESSGGEINPYGPNTVVLDTVSGTSCDDGTGVNPTLCDGIDITLRNLGSNTQTVDQMRFNFFSKNEVFLPGGDTARDGFPDAVEFVNQTEAFAGKNVLTRNEGYEGAKLTQIPGGGPATYSAQFEREGNPYKLIPGDAFMITVQYKNGDVATYFVSVQDL